MQKRPSCLTEVFEVILLLPMKPNKIHLTVWKYIINFPLLETYLFSFSELQIACLYFVFQPVDMHFRNEKLVNF